MKLALIGYGRMGKEVEKIALERKHTVLAWIDNAQDWVTHQAQFLDCDAAVEFTTPGVVVENILKCFEAGVPVVTGTTGWYQRLDEVKILCAESNSALFYASNFSIGVNIFFEINHRLASLMNRYEVYNVKIEEIHHLQKLDAPSGTAITLANDILNAVNRKTSWINGTAENPGQLEISSIREGLVPGIHTVAWDSEIDTISIRHEAKNRRGFAIGAIMAAEYLVGKKGSFGMKDLLNL